MIRHLDLEPGWDTRMLFTFRDKICTTDVCTALVACTLFRVRNIQLPHNFSYLYISPIPLHPLHQSIFAVNQHKDAQNFWQSIIFAQACPHNMSTTPGELTTSWAPWRPPPTSRRRTSPSSGSWRGAARPRTAPTSSPTSPRGRGPRWPPTSRSPCPGSCSSSSCA